MKLIIIMLPQIEIIINEGTSHRNNYLFLAFNEVNAGFLLSWCFYFDHVAVKINFTVLFKGNGLKHIILYYMAGAMAQQANHLPSSTGIPCEH